MGTQFKGLRQAMKGALQLVYPPQCMACSDTVSDVGTLCPTCWREADFITGPTCAACGAALPGDGVAADVPEQATGTAHSDAAWPDVAAPPLKCDDCLAIPRPWQSGHAVLTYRGTGRKLVLMLKHGDRLDIVKPLGDWLAAAAAPLISPDTLVVPVPLHYRRLFQRRYNQAGLLAARVAHHHGVPHLPELLHRRRHTPMQDHRDIDARFRNIEGAFAVRPRFRAMIQERPILLIDDVMTSGATLGAISDILLDAGTGSISIAVLARAVKET